MAGWLSLIFNYDYLNQGSSRRELLAEYLDTWLKSLSISNLLFSSRAIRDGPVVLCFFLSWQEVVNAQYKQCEIMLHKIIPQSQNMILDEQTHCNVCQNQQLMVQVKQIQRSLCLHILCCCFPLLMTVMKNKELCSFNH